MRLLDRPDPIDPLVAEALEAIDATLAGEPVDARHADLAEVALLLASDRPQVRPEFAHSLDERVARRFDAPANSGSPAPSPRSRRGWTAALGTLGALATGLAVVVAIVVVASGSHGASSASSSSAAAIPRTAAASGSATSSSASGPSGGQQSAANGRAARPPALTTPQTSSGSTSGGPAAPGLQPPSSGRRIVQSAQLDLTASPSRVDDVAQEVYDVVGAANGIVNSSTVTQTGGTDGYAQFQLSLPSSSLSDTMSKLSQLPYAHVASRTDNTQDITDQYAGATRALADARALRTSLLKQLANATTTEQVNSLTARIHDAEASISSDEATLARLNNQVNYSKVSVTVNALNAPVPVRHGSGFTLGGSAHDAGRVLTVAAGVALIAIAALTPVALVAALGWWIYAALRRRRREQALDLV